MTGKNLREMLTQVVSNDCVHGEIPTKHSSVLSVTLEMELKKLHMIHMKTKLTSPDPCSRRAAPASRSPRATALCNVWLMMKGCDRIAKPK